MNFVIEFVNSFSPYFDSERFVKYFSFQCLNLALLELPSELQRECSMKTYLLVWCGVEMSSKLLTLLDHCLKTHRLFLVNIGIKDIKLFIDYSLATRLESASQIIMKIMKLVSPKECDFIPCKVEKILKLFNKWSITKEPDSKFNEPLAEVYPNNPVQS